jgi:hypothetical protein
LEICAGTLFQRQLVTCCRLALSRRSLTSRTRRLSALATTLLQQPLWLPWYGGTAGPSAKVIGASYHNRGCGIGRRLPYNPESQGESASFIDESRLDRDARLA